jgi:hypothetical protein
MLADDRHLPIGTFLAEMAKRKGGFPIFGNPPLYIFVFLFISPFS